ncbi:MAG: hypothetical protein ABIG88_00570 [Patescibacteria group bacterium]
MAIVRMINCINCNQNKEVLVGSGMLTPDICDECKADVDKRKLDNFLKELKKMSAEERLARLEKIVHQISENASRGDVKY